MAEISSRADVLDISPSQKVNLMPSVFTRFSRLLLCLFNRLLLLYVIAVLTEPTLTVSNGSISLSTTTHRVVTLYELSRSYLITIKSMW